MLYSFIRHYNFIMQFQPCEGRKLAILTAIVTTNGVNSNRQYERLSKNGKYERCGAESRSRCRYCVESY